nr:MAG TPA: hypothetical protein [Caudoviricetes sp.]
MLYNALRISFQSRAIRYAACPALRSATDPRLVLSIRVASIAV